LFLYFIPLVFVLLILLHAIFGVMLVSRNMRLNALTQAWNKYDEQRKQLENFKQQASLFSQDAQSVQGLMGRRVDWSEKLNALSLDLPSGVWFTELGVRGTEFVLRGSVVSLEKAEVPTINKLVETLKADTRFSKDFSGFSLGPFKRKTAGSFEVVDFILNGTLNK